MLQFYYLVRETGLELTYHTPLFERGDFTKVCPQGHMVRETGLEPNLLIGRG